jgi:hypothetical protein
MENPVMRWGEFEAEGNLLICLSEALTLSL